MDSQNFFHKAAEQYNKFIQVLLIVAIRFSCSQAQSKFITFSSNTHVYSIELGFVS